MRFPVYLSILLALFSCSSRKEEPKKDDSQLFSSKLEHFDLLEDIALDAMKRNPKKDTEIYLKELKKTALTDWAECVNLMDEAAKLKIDDENESLRKDLHRYATQRIEQTRLYIRAEEDPGSHKFDNQIDSIEFEISGLLLEIKRKKKTVQDGVKTNGL